MNKENNHKTIDSQVGDDFLSVRNLVVEYTSDGEVIQAVNNVSFDLKKGKTLALVGETGAGKTTIAKAILQVLPEISAHVRSGEIYLNNQNLLALNENEMQKVRGNKISMVFQDPMTALNPTMRIGKQIAEVISAHSNISRKQAIEKASQMLEMVGITRERFNEYPHQFSGGMKQRVVIAIALACNPNLLLADEPTTALDVTIQAQVLDMIKKLQKELQTSMILITHDLGIVSETSDDVAVVYAGKIIEYTGKKELFAHPLHPYTQGLFGALPDLTSDAERLSPIDGLPPDPSNLPAGCSFAPRCPWVTQECRKEEIESVEVRPGHFCRCCHVASNNKVEV